MLPGHQDDNECKIKDLAERLKVSVRTIKNWEKQGYIPNARRNKWNWRVYNKEEILSIVAIVERENYFQQYSQKNP